MRKEKKKHAEEGVQQCRRKERGRKGQHIRKRQRKGQKQIGHVKERYAP
jgi:hypothetical protein